MDQKENRSERALAWYRSHGRDLSDLAALGVSLIVAGRATGDMPLPAALCALVTAALVPLRAPRPVRTQWGEIIAGLPRVVASVLTTYILLKFVIARPLACLWFGPFWPVVGVLIRFDWSTFSVTIRNLALAAISPLLRLFLKLDRERIAAWIDRQAWLVSPVSRETRRMAALLVAALWLLRGFMRPTLHGSADALWYGMNLADAVAQARAGVFPLFVGQSLYQFNGALCPIRIAPAFHYLGVTLDLLTFHAMGTFALQNLLLILVGVAGMGTSYATLRALLPGRPWLAAGLAALFLSCPGVLGVSYNTDLYMTWTTLPLIPLIWFATVRSFQDKGSSSTLLLLGSALGLSWWGHSPIALWSTFLAGAAQVTRLALGLRSGRANLGSAALGALAFGATAAYPVASVVLYPAAPATHVNLFQHAHPGTIVYFLQQVFPGAFLPLSAIGRSLGDFQFGYALWGLLLFLIWGQRRVRRPEVVVPTAAAALLALLLLPIPFLDTGLWTLVPGFVRDVTGNWPMSRLYFPLAGATVAGAAAAVTCSVLDDRARRTLSAIVAIGCLWSFSEAAKFAAGSKASAQPAASAVDSLRPENVQISRYSYSMTPDFPAHPSNFTHGATDPELENRLLSRDFSTEVAANPSSALQSAHLEKSGVFKWVLDNGLYNVAALNTPLAIEPGHSYLLQFAFTDPDSIKGVLQVSGAHFFREYGLPDHGGPRSFGAGGTHPNFLPVWTTAGPEALTVRYFPPAPVSANESAGIIAEVKLLSYDRGTLPVRVESWIPYRAIVRSPEAAWLETPRVYQNGYRALVNGQPAEVRKSPESLTAVAVPRGESRVELEYIAPTGLRSFFWLSFAAGVVALLAGAATGFRHVFHRGTA